MRVIRSLLIILKISDKIYLSADKRNDILFWDNLSVIFIIFSSGKNICDTYFILYARFCVKNKKKNMIRRKIYFFVTLENYFAWRLPRPRLINIINHLHAHHLHIYHLCCVLTKLNIIARIIILSNIQDINLRDLWIFWLKYNNFFLSKISSFFLFL